MIDFNDAQDQTDLLSFEKLSTDDIKRALHNRLQETLFYLFPQGKISSNQFKIGDVRGNKGDSLCVELSGPKIGLWHDFATNEGGDIIALWAAAHNMNSKTQFLEVVENIRTWLGTPQQPIKTKTVDSNYLGVSTKRWDYHDSEGNIIACVYRYDTPTGKEFRPWDVKAGKRRAPEPRPLYNQPAIKKTKNIILLVEGEKCAEALISIGICATTAMNGANAPIDKTDWTPLQGKHVRIWPDNDQPGKKYAEAVLNKLQTQGVASVAILIPPEDKPEGWDAADAVAEGMDVPDHITFAHQITPQEKKQESCEAADAVEEGMDIPAFLETAQQITPQENPRIPKFSLRDLLSNPPTVPDDLISPRILTPGGLLVFGGAPKVGKTDFLLNWLVHMAAGLPFKDMIPPRPLKIYYLQAELEYPYLWERVRKMNLNSETLERSLDNLFITSALEIILDEKGVETISDDILKSFDPSQLDIIAIDPLRNFYDGQNENDNIAMRDFVQNRVKRLRNLVNPNAGIILVHHTRKITKALLEEDPFNALSGASSLRCLCTSCILLFRPDEKESPRKIFFEFRYGERISAKIMDTIDGQWVELENTSERLVKKNHGERLDSERRRKHDVILQILYDEALKGQLYTPDQFSQAFENKADLGGYNTIRERIKVLATKGYIKFNKENTERSKYGFMVIEGMEIPTGEEIVNPETGEITKPMRNYLPTHFRDLGSGAVLPVENPNIWVYPQDDKN